MRIVRFAARGSAVLGVRINEEVVDLSIAAPELPRTLRALVAAGSTALTRAKAAAEKSKIRLPIDELTFCVPIADPPKILCIGRNYAAHAREGGAEPPTYPDVFMRSRMSLVAHEAAIIRPKLSEQLDFEGELLIVIGKTVANASPKHALEAVSGYSVFNDATIRDYQRQTSQWTVGKNFDATGAFGPEFVTPDELPPGAAGLRLQTRLNGNLMQDANTHDMIFSVSNAISILSKTMTLEPGDLIATGTPEGVGYSRTPPVWMSAGDTCEVEIERIGTLRNFVSNHS